MKNKLIYTCLLFLATMIFSCENPDGQLYDDFQSGAIPIFTAGESDPGLIDFADLDNVELNFSVDVEKTKSDVKSFDLIIVFNDVSEGTSTEVLYETVTTWPAEFTFTIDEILAEFDPDVVTEGSLELGDSFTFGAHVLMEDGRYLNGGYAPSVLATKPVIRNYGVACPSDLAGTFDLELISGDNGEADLLENIEVIELSPGTYQIQDMTMDIFGPDFPIRYNFTDVCGTLTAATGSVDFGTQVNIKFNDGTGYDPVTGDITFNIEYIGPSCCGLLGIKTSFIAKKKS
jgi:hypothetical protein